MFTNSAPVAKYFFVLKEDCALFGCIKIMEMGKNLLAETFSGKTIVQRFNQALPATYICT